MNTPNLLKTIYPNPFEYPKHPNKYLIFKGLTKVYFRYQLPKFDLDLYRLRSCSYELNEFYTGLGYYLALRVNI